MLYRFGAGTPIAQLLDPALFGVYLLCALTMVGFTTAVTLSQRIDWNNAAFGALVAAFPNTGYMGVPLLVALLGAQAAGPAIVTIVVDLIVTTSLCIALSRLDAADKHGVSTALRNALKGVLSNPMPWAIASGAVSSYLGLEPIKPVLQTMGLLADAASPVALFTIGAVLARSQMDSTDPTPLADYMPVAMTKLVLHPLLVLLVGSAAISLGLPLSKFSLTVIVLVAALPSASNVSLLAERFGANNGRIARVILVSTVLAFFTFSGAVHLMTGQ
jgi:malonate transporter and related proteins